MGFQPFTEDEITRAKQALGRTFADTRVNTALAIGRVLASFGIEEPSAEDIDRAALQVTGYQAGSEALKTYRALMRKAIILRSPQILPFDPQYAFLTKGLPGRTAA
jgi:hypothetical protein